MMTFTTSSLPPSPAQMSKGTKCFSFLYFSSAVPPSTLLYSPLMLSRVFVSTSLMSFISYFAWEAQMGKYDLFAKEQRLFFFFFKSQKLHIYLLPHQVNCHAGTFCPLSTSPSLPRSYRLRILPQFCDSNFFHLKRIEEKREIPSQFIRNKIETEKQVTEPDRQQSTMREKKKKYS